MSNQISVLRNAKWGIGNDVIQFDFPNGFTASVRGSDGGGFDVAAYRNEPDPDGTDVWVTTAYPGFDLPFDLEGGIYDPVFLDENGVELGKFISWVAELEPDFRLPNMTEFAEYIVKENGAVVSSGTHRNSDLIQSFMNALYELDRAKYAELHRDYNDVITKFWGDDGDNINYPTDELAVKISYFINEDLFNALNEVAPDGFCFGSHEGDGALFGFWPVDTDQM